MTQVKMGADVKMIELKIWKLICGFLDSDIDVQRFVEANTTTRQSIKLSQGTAGVIYFGTKGSYGLWRHYSLQMVSAT